MPARRRAADRGQDHHRPGRPLRLRLRHLHAARRSGEARGREVPQAVPARQDHRPDRRHLAVLLRQLVLEERSGAQQRDQRRRPGAVGHQGPPGRHAGLPACRRQMPRGRRLLRARRRRRLSQTWSNSAQRYMAQGFRHVRVQVGVARHGRLRRSRGTATVQGAARQAGVRARLRTPAARSSSSRSAARNWATKSNCCTTCTNA